MNSEQLRLLDNMKVVQAYKSGKQIQYFQSPEWVDVEEIVLSDTDSRTANTVGMLGILKHPQMYRIKPKELPELTDAELIAHAVCCFSARWEKSSDKNSGEFCFLGIRYYTSLNEKGVPIVTDNMRHDIHHHMRLRLDE